LEDFDMNTFSRLTLLVAILTIFCPFISAQTEAMGNGQNPVASGSQEAAATQQAPSGGGAGDLQKAVQNPVASLTSVRTASGCIN
jgi:hypothetical protein